MSKIFVLAEHRKGSLRDITWEMLNKGAELASDTELVAVLLGHQVGGFDAILVEAPSQRPDDIAGPAFAKLGQAGGACTDDLDDESHQRTVHFSDTERTAQ